MPEKWMRLPIEASAHAGQVDAMIVSVHWLIAAIALIFGLFFVVCLVRFHRRAHPRARYRNVSPRIAWTLVTVITAVELWELFFVAIPFWRSRVAGIPSAPDATVVRVVAQQFSWNIHYPGPDGRFGRTAVSLVSRNNPVGLDRTDPPAKDDIFTVNEFYFPAGKPVLVHLTSKDMIHSFSLPQMRVKQDAIPGLTIPVWFVPTVATPDGETWEINCSQLCGLGHYTMRGFYRSMTPGAFQQFLDDEAAALKAASMSAQGAGQ
jgi:cytochrome c oxidase subunit 2